MADMMDFEWSAEKAKSNINKHGVSFEDAARVFFDPGRVDIYDDREHYGEERWAVIGMAWSAVLYVVYTMRHQNTIRIISARKADAQEEKRYCQANA